MEQKRGGGVIEEIGYMLDFLYSLCMTYNECTIFVMCMYIFMIFRLSYDLPYNRTPCLYGYEEYYPQFFTKKKIRYERHYFICSNFQSQGFGSGRILAESESTI